MPSLKWEPHERLASGSDSGFLSAANDFLGSDFIFTAAVVLGKRRLLHHFA